MRNTPPLALSAPSYDGTVHVVLEDFGELGNAWREIAEDTADEQSIVESILRGEYARTVRVVAFNTSEGWSRDVTDRIAAQLLDATLVQRRVLSQSAREFVERVIGQAVTVVV